MPEISREAMIATGEASTAHSRNATVYSSDEMANSVRSPIRGTSRLATIIAPTSAAAATADDSATSGAPAAQRDDPQRQEREPGEHADVGEADRQQHARQGRLDREHLADGAATPAAASASRGRGPGRPPALTAIAIATATNSRARRPVADLRRRAGRRSRRRR